MPVGTGLGYESTSTWIATNASERVDQSDDAITNLVKAGVTHLVATEKSDSIFLGSPNFEQVVNSGDLRVWKVIAPEWITPPPSLVAVSQAHQEYMFELNANQAGLTEIPVAYSPKWRAENEDGERLNIHRSDVGLTVVETISGTSVLTLKFQADRYDRIGETLTLAALALATIGMVRRRRTISSTLTPSSNGDSYDNGDKQSTVSPKTDRRGLQQQTTTSPPKALAAGDRQAP